MTGSGGGAMRLDAMAATAGTKVLVVDDEPYITELLATTLRLAGYDVLTAGSGAEAVRAAESGNPELLILDIMLPDTDGFELCRRLRLDRPRLPVVFLTARDSTEDKVRGLTLGGDDYVTKPFSVAEVLARVQAVLRRTRGGQEESAALRCGELVLDEEAHEVHRAGRQLELSPTEYKLLRYLLVNAGRVVSKAQILDHVWQYDFGGDAAVVEKFISRLRHKVDAEGSPLIHTVRGFGYTLRPAKG
ncbi:MULTISPECIES: response regulator transcription factor [unclassified Crossiella]|uniref:response regulator transcription factor n=1 Tax=unclassified Crossiella TaxID=2620835 RepID=UPI002494AB66|nr:MULTISPECIES: response regulator transcription factor [unclassified Crossiella]